MACKWTLTQLIEATSGQILSDAKDSFVGVGTDTRQDLTGQIFVALVGEKHDAHDFVERAIEKGAACVIVHEQTEVLNSFKARVAIVKVSNTLIALQSMARYWRRKVPAKVVGITGSNGKTSTREFAKTILGTRKRVHSSKGSFNNHWGVPLTLLGISMRDDVALVEIGMNHAGEIEKLSKIAEPDVVVCVSVGRAHIGMFDGSIQAIADAKEEIYLNNPKAVMIFNYDNEFTIKMFERVSKLIGPNKTVAFSSFSAGSEVSLRATQMDLSGLKIIGHIGGVKSEALVPIFGRHNVANLMAASCIALTLGVEPEEVWANLPKCRPQWGRGQLCQLPTGANVLFDAYNANPDSMAALVKNVFEINLEPGGRKIAVLGEMLELGDNSETLHFELGETVGQTDMDIIYFFGPSAAHFERGVRNTPYDKKLVISTSYEETLASELASVLNRHDVIVIKGSRGMHLERVMQIFDPKFTVK